MTRIHSSALRAAVARGRVPVLPARLRRRRRGRCRRPVGGRSRRRAVPRAAGRRAESRRCRGEAAPVSIQVGVAQAGPVQIELIQQHCDRPSIFRGLDPRRLTSPSTSCRTVTSRLRGQEGALRAARLRARGREPDGPFRVAYFDTVEDFGFYTEVVEETPGFLAQLGMIAETCASWDGTDPVRLLTRDGYRVP